MLAVLPGCAFIDFKFACHKFTCRQKKQKGNFYEKEKRYIDAEKWLKKAIARGGGNTEYFAQKLEAIKVKENTPQKKRRKAKVSEDSMDFERKTYSAAIYFMKKFGWE